jgi:hypothetical protein
MQIDSLVQSIKKHALERLLFFPPLLKNKHSKITKVVKALSMYSLVIIAKNI